MGIKAKRVSVDLSSFPWTLRKSVAESRWRRGETILWWRGTDGIGRIYFTDTDGKRRQKTIGTIVPCNASAPSAQVF